MGYNTASTEWPSTTPSAETKALIDNLFLTLDNDQAGAGDELADNIFAPDGVLVGPNGKAEGAEAIRRCRDDAWNVVKQRRHTVLRVYAHDAHALDLLLIGNVEMNLANGKYVAGEFIARVLLVEAEADSPKIKFYQVWADLAPMMKALQSD